MALDPYEDVPPPVVLKKIVRKTLVCTQCKSFCYLSYMEHHDGDDSMRTDLTCPYKVEIAKFKIVESGDITDKPVAELFEMLKKDSKIIFDDTIRGMVSKLVDDEIRRQVSLVDKRVVEQIASHVSSIPEVVDKILTDRLKRVEESQIDVSKRLAVMEEKVKEFLFLEG